MWELAWPVWGFEHCEECFGKIATFNAIFAHAQRLMVQHASIVVVMEYVVPCVVRTIAWMRNAIAIQDGTDQSVKKVSSF